MKTRIGIFGYGNLGRGVECALQKTQDMELAAVFTRRAPASLKIQTAGVPVIAADSLSEWKDRIDVLILCGGSATDLPVQTPSCVRDFNVVDSFDTHANIPSHFRNVDAVAKQSGHIGIISVGWDPGLFSLARVYSNAVLPCGKDYTFWGRGLSQGHSDAVRRIKGVKDARQYTVPNEEAMNAVRSGLQPELSVREKHSREVYVVAEEGADKARIEKEIKEMPNYFSDYDTEVHFITEEELRTEYAGMGHGGSVLRSGTTGFDSENSHMIEFTLKLDSNPQFTSSVLTAYARAAKRLYDEGQSGARTVLDIPPAYLCEQSGEELRSHLL